MPPRAKKARTSTGGEPLSAEYREDLVERTKGMSPIFAEVVQRLLGVSTKHGSFSAWCPYLTVMIMPLYWGRLMIDVYDCRFTSTMEEIGVDQWVQDLHQYFPLQDGLVYLELQGDGHPPEGRVTFALL